MIGRETRREFMRDLGLSAAVAPFVWNLPGLGLAATGTKKQRLVIMFSPNGVVPWNFWPEQQGRDFELPAILAPLKPFRDQLLVLKGISNKVRGDGDSHMRGMSCLLTGVELFPGNIQGGSHTPAGWPRGLSIDQEIKNYFQSRPETRTRFGSLEFGVGVPHRADPWTRMVYAGPNKPIVPIDDPYQMFRRMYGRMQDQATVKSVLDDVRQELGRVRRTVSAEDRRLLDEHVALVRQMEQELVAAKQRKNAVGAPRLDPGVKNTNDNIPTLARMQMDLMISSFRADMTRVATLQFTNSVGQSHMRWIGVEEGHHELSHHPDSKKESQEKLTKIDTWFCQQLADLTRKLADTPEPGADGSMLDHTTLVWTNELGKGNSHTLNDIPFVLVGRGLGFKMGRSLKYDRVAHNRLHLAIAHAMGHRIETFGKPALCADGPLPNLS